MSVPGKKIYIKQSNVAHSTILCVTQQFGQDVNFIYDFDIIWSSKWLWSIIFLSKSSYLDDRTFPGFLPKQFAYFPTPIICICRQVISIFVRVCCFLNCSSIRIYLSNPLSLSPSYRVMDRWIDGWRNEAWLDFSLKQIVHIFQLKQNILPQPASFS